MLSENKLILLGIGIKNNGILRWEDAMEIYSAKDSALSSLQSLRARGYIRKTRYVGVFRVVKAPTDSFRIAENLKKEQKE